MTAQSARPRRKILALSLGLLALAAGSLSGETPGASFATPQLIGDGWDREDPAKAGFDAARLRALLDSIPAREPRLHGLIVERHGRLVAELYRPGKDESPYIPFAYRRSFGPATLHDLRSVGKSVVGLLFGIARPRGGLGDLSRPVLDFYPEWADLATPARRAITLEHLLTMSSGLEWREGGGFPDDENRLVWKGSPVRFVLDRPVLRAPGSTFSYHSGGTAVLADVISRGTGLRFEDFARSTFFEPMGIRHWEWTHDLHGRTRVYDGLRMRPRDLAKIGRMVLDQGRWKGRQIVPADWIAAALQPRLPTGFDDVQYGYQWWTGTLAWQGRTLRWHAAFGLGNQRLFLVPDLDLSVVVTAGAYAEDLQPAARRINAFFKDLVTTLRPEP